MADDDHTAAVLKWRAEREQSIRRENGWLALAGLFWLKLGRNRVGSDPVSEISLPERAPAHIGDLQYDGQAVTWRAAPGQRIKVDNQFADVAVLQPDTADAPSFIELADLRLVVIQRGRKVGVRMWDNLREERRLFPARTWYAISKAYRMAAQYTGFERPKTVFFPGLTGERSEFPVHGFIAFDRGGSTYKLDVTREDDGSYFLRYWDPTGNLETYPSGRYLIATVEDGGKVVLDFNYAYNPPCAFTNFATCVFAPPQNRLDFSVEAGETYSHP